MEERFRFRLIGALFILLLLPLGAFAQTTAVLSGTTTADGNPLPGVLVTISSPSLQGTRTAVTGEGGGYTFPALPPGVYTVRFTLEGMQPVTKKVTLTLAQTVHADAQMRVGAAEAITVTASAPAVIETTQVGSNFNQNLVSELPVARNIRQTVLLAPGVNPNGVNNQITISGGPSYDNIFLVNGVVVNENLRGQPHNLFIEDAIQETTVLTAGISAEYGRFTGGVVSTLTKSGGNEFSGSLRDTMTNPSWTSTVKDGGAKPVDKTNQVYEGTLGGRILTDRLWFFAAGRKAKTGTDAQTFQTKLNFVNGFNEKRWEGKLTGAITPKHSIVASALDVKNDETNNYFGSIYDLASIVPSRSLPNSLQTVNYNGVFTNNLIGEVTWSNKKFAFENSGGRYRDFIKGTWIGDSVTGARMNAPVFCGVCTNEERNSDGIGAKATYFWSTRALGNHSIVFGADQFHETRIVNNNQSGSDFSVTGRVIVVGSKVYPRFDSTTTLTWWPIFENSKGTDLKSDAAYVNDKWDLNSKMSFNIGLRFDRNHSVDADGNLISSDSNVSPRIGAQYDIRGDGRHRLTGSFARYVAKITDGSNVLSTGQAAGSPGSFTWQYAGPAVNPAGTADDQLVTADVALQTMLNWFNSIGGTNNTDFTSSSYPGYGSRFKGSLASPSTDEYSVGYGTQFVRNAYARFDYVHRQWHNFYAREADTPGQFIIPPNNAKADMNFTVNDDQYTHRKYDALEFQSQWTRNAINIGANYTWSKLKGNDVSEGAGTATIRNTPGQIFYPEYLSYAQRRPDGFLSQDRRHRARAWVSYEIGTPIGRFNLSALESFDSGFAYSAVGTIDATGRNANFKYAGVPVNPGYNFSGAGISHDYFFSKRGEFRTDNRLATDLALNYYLPIFRSFQFFLRGDVLNVFDKQVIVDPGQLNSDVITSRTGGVVTYNADGSVPTDPKKLNSGLSPFNPFTDKPIECPQGNSARQCAEMHANYQLGPKFGKANSADAYQVGDRSLAPRTYRLSFGFRF